MDVGGRRFYFCPKENAQPGDPAEKFAEAKKRNQAHALRLLESEPEPKCQVCGCTEERPCMTDNGMSPLLEPCCWIAPGVLCSACLGKVPLPGTEEDLLVAMGPLIESATPIGFRLPAIRAFQLMSVLQMARRTESFGEDLLGFIEELGRGLQDKISVTPVLAAMCEAGWNRALDISSEQHLQAKADGKILLPGRDF